MALTQKQYRDALAYEGKKAESTTINGDYTDQRWAVDTIKSLMERQKSLNLAQFFDVKFACGTKPRLFLSENGELGQFNKGAKKWGYPVLGNLTITQIVTYAANQDASTKAHLNQIRCVEKYVAQAKKAGFTNHFIRKCLNANPLCSPFENGLSSGVPIEGQLVSVKSLAKYCEQYFGIDLIASIAERKSLRTGRFPYNGYDGSIELRLNEAGDYQGWFNKEYRNCGNGRYYLLINEEQFVGYDID